MQRAYKFISFQRQGEVFCVHLQQMRVEDHEVEELGAELARLIDEESCRKMILSLGPREPECLFSLFLAKLIGLQRRLDSGFALAHVSADARLLFRGAGIEKFFRFYPDQQSALQALNAAGK